MKLNAKITIGGCLLAMLLAGCSSMPLRPGRAAITNPNGLSVTVQQSQNPKQETTQKYEKTTENGKTVEKVETKIGAAQKDVAREIGAKLAGLRPVMYVGILLFVFGAASLFYPPLKVIVGSSTTSIMACVAGVALIALPSLIVGNELLILCVGVGAVGIYWFSHQHGKLRGFVDANKDGIDDRKQ